jgi:flagellar biogenesis protein FliO
VQAPAASAGAAAPPGSAAPPPAASAATLPTIPTRPSQPLTFAPAASSTPLGYKVIAGIGVAAAAVLYALRRRKSPAKKIRAKIDVLGRTSLGVRSELLVVDVEGTRLLVGLTPSAIQTLAVLETPEGTVGALADEAPEKKLRELVDDEATPDEVGIARSASDRRAAARGLGGSPMLDDDSEVRRMPQAKRKSEVPPARPSREIQALLATRRSSTRMPAVTEQMIADRRDQLAADRGDASASPSPVPRRRRSLTGASAVAGQARGLLLSLDDADADEVDAAPLTGTSPGTRKPIRLGEW